VLPFGAFNALTALDTFYRQLAERIVELCRVSRPAVAAAAVKALVRAQEAKSRSQSPPKLS
jgi:hypothetical protein